MRAMASKNDATHLQERRRYVDDENGLTEMYSIINTVVAPVAMIIVMHRRIKFLRMVTGDAAAAAADDDASCFCSWANLYRICFRPDAAAAG